MLSARDLGGTNPDLYGSGIGCVHQLRLKWDLPCSGLSVRATGTAQGLV